jgi:hypothetical protein
MVRSGSFLVWAGFSMAEVSASWLLNHQAPSVELQRKMDAPTPCSEALPSYADYLDSNTLFAPTQLKASQGLK